MMATIRITPTASSAIKARARGTSASVTSCTARKIRSGEMCTVSEVTPRKRYSGRTLSNAVAQRRRLAVRWSALLAICLESFMKDDIALRKVPVK